MVFRETVFLAHQWRDRQRIKIYCPLTSRGHVESQFPPNFLSVREQQIALGLIRTRRRHREQSCAYRRSVAQKVGWRGPGHFLLLGVLPKQSRRLGEAVCRRDKCRHFYHLALLGLLYFLLDLQGLNRLPVYNRDFCSIWRGRSWAGGCLLSDIFDEVEAPFAWLFDEGLFLFTFQSGE